MGRESGIGVKDQSQEQRIRIRLKDEKREQRIIPSVKGQNQVRRIRTRIGFRMDETGAKDHKQCEGSKNSGAKDHNQDRDQNRCEGSESD